MAPYKARLVAKLVKAYKWVQMGVHKVISKLHNEFSLKKLVKPEYSLGLEVKYHLNGSFILTQTKYIRDLLGKVNMEEVNGVAIHMLSHYKLGKFGTDTMQDPLLYRSIVGALYYITLTRPDISYCLSKACQFMDNPLKSH